MTVYYRINDSNHISYCFYYQIIQDLYFIYHWAFKVEETH